MAFLELRHLVKRFGQVEVVRDISLEVGQGDMLVLLGPSGSGKTTLLRLLAGFETPDAGRVVVDGDDVTALRPAARRCGMVFQHYALFPHLTVAENVAFGLEARGASRTRIAARVREVLALVDLAAFGRRAITELSGGQQQRVALARALAPEPRVLLLDEPLSNLDPALRERTRRELKDALRRVGITTVFVTHEQEEAFALGDRVAVIREGRLEQEGTPDELYETPRTRFVATFVGRANELRGTVARAAGDGTGEVSVGPARWPARLADGVEPGGEVAVIVRPEGFDFVAEGGAAALGGSVLERRYAGGAAYFTVLLATGDAVDVLAPPRAVAVGDAVWVAPTSAVRAFP